MYRIYIFITWAICYKSIYVNLLNCMQSFLNFHKAILNFKIFISKKTESFKNVSKKFKKNYMYCSTANSKLSNRIVIKNPSICYFLFFFQIQLQIQIQIFQIAFLLKNRIIWFIFKTCKDGLKLFIILLKY